MKKKIGIVDADSSFVKRFVSLMNSKYDDIEILIFPELHLAQTAANQIGLSLLFIDGSVAKRNHLNSNKKILIPEQCKVVILTTGDTAIADCDFPSVCKYKSLEEWRDVINHFCKEESALTLGGCKSGSLMDKTCLLISKGGGVGASAATTLANYFKEKGKKSIVIIPYIQNGEDVLRVVDNVKESFDITFLFIPSFDDDSIVVPSIKADAIIFVSNGENESNEIIKDTFKKLPLISELSKENLLGKSFVLYNEFKKDESELLKDDILCLGGIDSKENIIAACEKLEIYLCMKR